MNQWNIYSFIRKKYKKVILDNNFEILCGTWRIFKINFNVNICIVLLFLLKFQGIKINTHHLCKVSSPSYEGTGKSEKSQEVYLRLYAKGLPQVVNECAKK